MGCEGTLDRDKAGEKYGEEGEEEGDGRKAGVVEGFYVKEKQGQAQRNAASGAAGDLLTRTRRGGVRRGSGIGDECEWHPGGYELMNQGGFPAKKKKKRCISGISGRCCERTPRWLEGSAQTGSSG